MTEEKNTVMQLVWNPFNYILQYYYINDDLAPISHQTFVIKLTVLKRASGMKFSRITSLYWLNDNQMPRYKGLNLITIADMRRQNID